jgi:hypothetical protein
VVVCVGHPVSYAALSTWQGTDHPHVCPPLGGPATEPVPARTARVAIQHSVTPNRPATAEPVPVRTARVAIQHSVTPNRPATAEPVPARTARVAIQHSVTPNRPATAEPGPARTARVAIQHSVPLNRPATTEAVLARPAQAATQHSLATAYTRPRAEPTVGGWCVTCGAWATRNKYFTRETFCVAGPSETLLFRRSRNVVNLVVVSFRGSSKPQVTYGGRYTGRGSCVAWK